MMASNDFKSTMINGFSNPRIWGSLVPYITVGIGLLLLKNVWVAMIGYHLAMLVILFLDRGSIAFRPVLSRGNYKILMVTTAMGVSGGLLLYLLWPLLGISNTINLNIQNMGLNASSWPFFIAYFILVNGWLEELYWRVYLGSNSKMITLGDVLFARNITCS